MFRLLSTRFGVGCATFAVTALFATVVSAQCARGNFGGFSIGIDAGLLRSGSNGDYAPPLTSFPASTPFSASDTVYGPLLGGRVGYNVQCGAALYGIEMDWAFASLDSSATYNDPFGTTPFTTNSLTTTTSLKNIATLRARLGFIAGHNWLFYGTGGLAFGKVTHSITVQYPGVFPDTFSTSSKSWEGGWTAGLGIEYAWGQWSMRAETLYVDLADSNLTFGLPAAFGTPPNQNANWENVFLLTRIGLTYRY